jgi:hypothetical protein
MAKISLGAGTFEGVEVDLWGSLYKTVRITRSVQNKVDKALKKLDDTQDADAAVKVLADVIDARLEPQNGAGPPSKLIVEKWKTDELSLDQLQQFQADLDEAEAPPT